MRNINIKKSLELREESLRDAAEILDLKAARRRGTRKWLYTTVSQWQAMIGDQPTGAPFDATYKEVKVMGAAAEKVFTKALDKWKPGQPRPRLTTYQFVEPEKPAQPEKKLWEK